MGPSANPWRHGKHRPKTAGEWRMLTRTKRLVPNVMTSLDTPYSLAVTIVAVLNTLLAKVKQKVREA